MHTKSIRLFLPLIFLILGSWSNDQTTVDVSGLKKNRINFYGSLHTRNGEINSVDNVSIGRLYKQIIVYAPPASNKQKLPEDPKKGIITKLDLKEIQEIRVPQPYTIFHFQSNNGSRKTDYITIEVKQGSHINSYLIDTHRKLMCDQISPSGPIEKEVPFHALDRIILTGYKQRDETKQENKNDTIHTKESIQEKIKRCGCN